MPFFLEIFTKMWIYPVLLSFTGFIGFALNIFLFIKFSTSKKKPLSGFHKLCLSKTVPNLIISSVFAFWASTLTFLGKKYADIPRIQNLIISQSVGGFSYFAAPLIQVCMSVNRFTVIYFPFSTVSELSLTNLAIFGCFLFSNIPTFLSILTDCYLVYDPELLIFLPERLEECGHVMDKSVFVAIMILSFLSNGFNLLIFMKLLKDKMNGISEVEKRKRRRRFQTLFIQSVIQDFIQLIDITNYNFTAKLVNSEWWTFLCCSLSFAAVYALDGLVMVYFHTNWKCCGLKKNNTTSSPLFVSGVQSSGAQIRQKSTNAIAN